MLAKIRNRLYFIFMLSFAILGVVEATIVKKTVVLFKNLSIPAFTRWTLPMLTIGVFVMWGFWMLARLGGAMEAEDADNFHKSTEITTRILTESPTVCAIVGLGGVALLDSMKTDLIAWEFSQTIYSYGMLWLLFFPTVSFILEFLQSITGIPNTTENQAKYLKQYQCIDGVVCSLLGFINLYLLISIADMSVCKYFYIVFTIIIIYRIFRYYHLSALIWMEPENTHHNTVDEKEGIL